MGWTILAIIAAVVLLFMMRRSTAYKKLFSDKHVLEIAEGIAHLKESALANIETADEQQVVSRDDPRVLVTSQNLRVFYTVTQDGSVFEHHYSISIAQGYTASAVGESFSLYVAYLLGFTSQQFAIERSQRGIYHVEWQFSPAEQKAFAKRAVKVPTREELPKLYERIAQWRKEVFVQQAEIPLPE